MSQPTAKDLIAEASEQRKSELYEPLLVRLFQTYDEDESGTLEANEIRQIMLDCIEDERKVLNEKEVFHISDQIYTYEEAKCKCASYNGRLATESEIVDAYNNLQNKSKFLYSNQ